MSAKPRVLVVYKKSAFQQFVLERRDPRLKRLLRQRDPDVLDMHRSDAVHQRSIETVVRELRKASVHVDLAARADLKVTKTYDLVVSVGGDGTFLQAARSLPASPILGVNSHPERSEAVFSAATAKTFPVYLRRALEGELPELHLARLVLSLNGRLLVPRAVNDVLLAHSHPAVMSRYRLKLGRREDLQKSSGLWVATAAGAGSAVLAAGGRRLPWGADRFQYRPRELYTGRLSRPVLRGSVLDARQVVEVKWLMRSGVVYVDGPHVAVPLLYGDRLDIRLSMRQPVRVLGFASSRQGRRRV